MKVIRLFPFLILFVAGCSVFPGLRVLTGEDTGDTTTQSAEAMDIVMADKTGATDPSLMAAANRIEAASPNVDIIEIRRDETNDAFVVNMLFLLPGDANGQTQASLISRYSAIQRAMELTWQGTLAESEGTGLLRINLITPEGISTLDSGLSFIGFVTATSEIERIHAVDYLRGSRNLNDFLDLIATGILRYENPQGLELYTGEPNHPLFMLDNAVQANTSESS